MKLYTEEQVRFIIQEAREVDWWEQKFDFTVEDITSQLTLIELPSDEEIEWINIKDELPPNSKHVLFYLPLIFNIAMGYQKDGKINIFGDFMGEPTHWRLLPKSPKEQILNQNK